MRLKHTNDFLLKLQKDLILLKNKDNTQYQDKISIKGLIEETNEEINNIKNGIIVNGFDKSSVCVNGSWQNIISAYMNRGFVTTDGNDKQLEFVKNKIISDINNTDIKIVLIIGLSFGGMVANKLCEILDATLIESQREKVRVITINSIQISPNPSIVNYMHIGDVALKTSRLNTPPRRYLDRVITKGSEPLIRYKSRRTGNIVWYCYPSTEPKTRGKCKHISHVSFFNPYSHRSVEFDTIIKILVDVNNDLSDVFDSKLIILGELLKTRKDIRDTFNEYQIKDIDLIRKERTKGGKRVKRKKTLKSYLNI